MLFKTESGIALNANPVQIGSRYSRKHSIVRDESTGEYWERMPTFGHYEELLQRGLLKNRKAIITSVTEIEVMEFLRG